eukprot:CAMPEP_0183316420 /NCGR_PEP_ID=MMETSP0160_2-20130417/54916_1 /TAXON_ID=2839 ORGANISM="Odontella Sinensis, Strain Grunow 1884" /NCGR_SAMPLE_ID=MMETSP0160_2 /ASSEMBLY_ACC=CAM_ASM_000250 /LENGTH=37 /DNA_ID= /DNA_START= /DNA_END= /DNA_ORIENTATION=
MESDVLLIHVVGINGTTYDDDDDDADGKWWFELQFQA